MRKGLAWIAAGAILALASGASAHVIDPAVNKDAFKLRADIAKQVSKYTFCLVKAATTCEKKSPTSAPECGLAAGTAAFEDPKGKIGPKFIAAIAKCDAKLNLTKKGTDYVGVGCPGDCSTDPGIQQCADIPSFEATVESTTIPTSAKNQLGALAAAIDGACGIDTGAPNTDEGRIDCTLANAKLLTKYAQGLYKCMQKCELDVKDKKGNGGTTNDGSCLVGSPEEDPNFTACEQKSFTKINPKLSPTVSSVVLPLVRVAVGDANDGLFNRFDPTSTADASPCGTCGDNTRAGSEECDGSDDSACPGACNADCTCP